MDKETFARLIAELRSDAELFHAFIFEPVAALRRLSYIDESTSRALRAVDPRSFLADAAGLLERETGACGPDTTCSCTSGTCGGATCGGSTCDVTCGESSCGNTCGDSCGTTTLFQRQDYAALLSPRARLSALANQAWDDAHLVWE